MERLERVFASAEEYRCGYIAIGIQSDNPEVEIIINPRCNFDAKLKYYKLAYDADLVLKANKNIRIISAYAFFDADIKCDEIIDALSCSIF
jgi:hypothetical protein